MKGGLRKWSGIAGIALMCAAGVAIARSASAPFQLTVTLLPPFKDVVGCGTSQQGAEVSVSCGGDAVSGASPRFLLHVYRDGTQVGTVQGATSPGTVTSWKVVRIADRDFLEIVVGW